MKKIILALFIGLMFQACTVTKQQSSMIGQFSGQARWDTMTLSLNSNETFHINWNYDYTGKWEVLDENHISLNFESNSDEITNSGILLMSYSLVGTREKFIIESINKNKVILLPRGYILKRVK